MEANRDTESENNNNNLGNLRLETGCPTIGPIP